MLTALDYDGSGVISCKYKKPRPDRMLFSLNENSDTFRWLSIQRETQSQVLSAKFGCLE